MKMSKKVLPDDWRDYVYSTLSPYSHGEFYRVSKESKELVYEIDGEVSSSCVLNERVVKKAIMTLELVPLAKMEARAAIVNVFKEKLK